MILLSLHHAHDGLGPHTVVLHRLGGLGALQSLLPDRNVGGQNYSEKSQYDVACYQVSTH